MINPYVNSIKKINFFLICLIPGFLITGPFFSDFAVVLISSFFIIFNFKKIDLKNKFIILFLFFFLVLIISSLLSNHLAFSLGKTISYIRFLFLCLAIFFIVKDEPYFLNYFSKFFIFLYLLLIIDGYFQFFFGVNTIGLITPFENRLSGFFGKEMILGSYLSRFLPLLIFCLFYLNSNKKIIIIFLFLASLLVLLTGERTALIYVLFANIYFILQIKLFRIFGMVALLLLIISTILLYNYNIQVKNRFDQTFVEIGISDKYKPGYSIGDQPVDNSKEKKIFKNFNFFSPMHENYLYTSLQMFKDKPVFGHGPNTYRKECSNPKYRLDDLSCSTHPHHTYAQILAELGLVGFVIILLIFIYFVFISLRHFIFSIVKKKNNKYLLTNFEICFICYFLINLWPFTPSGNFFNNWLSIVYFFPIGFYLGIKNIKKKFHDKS